MPDTKQEKWERYTSAWKAEGGEAKEAILRDSIDDGATYCDPLTTTTGIEALVQYMVEFHQQIPGGHFVTTYFLAHHDTSITRWNMVDANGDVLGDGISHGRYDSNDKLLTMTGFFETPTD